MRTQGQTSISRGIAGAAAYLITTAAQIAEGAFSASTEFQVDISPYARVLNALGTPEFSAVVAEQSCDNPNLRVRVRNKPAIMVTVPDAVMPGVELQSFTLQINSDPYFFGAGDTATDGFADFVKQSPYSDPDVTILGSTVSADMRTLTVNFEGLTAGKRVIFNVDLDVVDDPDMYLYPDYRAVLTGAPTSAVATPTAPATFSGVFSDGAETLMQSSTLPQQTESPTYINQNIRPYDRVDRIEVVPGRIGVQTSAPFKVNVPTVLLDTMQIVPEAIKLTGVGDVGSIIDVLGFMISGDDAALFRLEDFAGPDATLDDQIVAGGANDTVAYDLKFLGGSEARMYMAEVTLLTTAGNVVFPVMATAVPEPMSLALASLGLAVAWRARQIGGRGHATPSFCVESICKDENAASSR